ncbi:MAG: PGN_0703 family putative restriction endonuclease [Ilumatobacteraceae bacterium]
MSTRPTRAELEAAFCWEADDQIPSRPAMTAFRREARYHQARWREACGHPIGTQPIVPKPGDSRVRPVGSRLPLDYARDTGANFLTAAAWNAARARTAFIEARQSLDHQRLWADLLSSTALSFNLFGDLAADLALADRAVHRWFPDTPGRVSEVRFAHSPGWFDPAYINSLRSFATVFILDRDDGSRGLVAIDVKYHERSHSGTPRPENLTRYTEVAERARVFAPGAIDALSQRGDLCVIWIEHLLLFSMLQHPGDNFTWGRYVVVHPARNVDVVDVGDRYRAMLADGTSFATMTLEQLLDTDTLPEPVVDALRGRYLFD